MRLRSTAPRVRCGATLIEAKWVLITLLILMITLIVAAIGVSRYQMVSMAAREGARYAAVNGGLYALEFARPAVTTADILERINLHVPFNPPLTTANVEVFLHYVYRDPILGVVGSRVRDPWDATHRFPWVMEDNLGTIRWSVVEVRVQYDFASTWLPRRTPSAAPPDARLEFERRGFTFESVAKQTMHY